MPLVTSKDYQLVPDLAPIAQRIGQIMQTRKTTQRQDEQIAKKEKAIQVKDAFLRTANNASRIRDIKDPIVQRTEISKMARESIEKGADPAVWINLLNNTSKDELNLGLTKIFTDSGDAGEIFKQGLKDQEQKEAAQFEPVLDEAGNIVAQRNVQTGQVIADPRAGQRKKKTDKDLKADLKATDTQFERSKKLRSEITKVSTDFKKQEGAWARVQASGEDPSPAGDLALIFNFMKVLDPGSTVREGEFAQVGAAGSLPTQAQRMYNQWAVGEKLTIGQRKDVMGRAKKLFTSAQKLNKKDIGRIISVGKQFNIPKKLLLGEEVAEEVVPDTITLPNGVVVRRVK